MNLRRQPTLSFNTRRVIVGLWLVISLLSVGNHFLGWGAAAPYTKQVMVLSYVILGVLILTIMPKREDWEEYRRNKSLGRGR